MTMLAGLVDVVVGVDAHKHTHTAAIVDAVTGAAVADRTVVTDPDGYATLVEFAATHDGVARLGDRRHRRLGRRIDSVLG